MRVTLADKLREAFAEAGQELPTKSKPTQSSQNQKAKHKHKAKNIEEKPGEAPRLSDRNGQPESETAHKKSQPTSQPTVQKPEPVRASPRTKQVYKGPDLSVYRNGVSGKAPSVTKVNAANNFHLSLSRASRPNWLTDHETDEPGLLEFGVTGQEVQPLPIQEMRSRIDRELVMGLDFGTSSVKAVIGDRALGRTGKAFAVPFRASPGLQGFLLPCRLYQVEDTFSLEPGGTVLANLKLALLNSPESDEARCHVVAFLALVIRRARAWLLCQHETVYRSSNIVWSMAIGLPTANHINAEQSGLFGLLGKAAWTLAGSDEDTLNVRNVQSALLRAERLQQGAVPAAHEDVELSIIPEIAAQIYGYVASEQFDPKAANHFMIVDVGAGTVDASLFHVKTGRGRKKDFVFYTATVEPLGTVNLHRQRLNWWASAIQERFPKRKGLLEAISSGMKVSDTQAGFPGHLEDYFSKISLKFDDPRQNADRQFYSKVFNQVVHDTYWMTSQGHLSRTELKDIPVYFCGGGSRMPFYERLSGSLNNHPNLYEWMSVKVRQLTKPRRLEAPGLSKDDYDRLSVAYGLSFLEVGKVLKSIPKPKVILTDSEAWRENYIEK